MRTGKNIAGLVDMIKYISAFGDTSKMLIAEIGVFMGAATVIFAKHFKTVFAVDPWDRDHMNVANSDPDTVYSTFVHKTYNMRNIKCVRLTSEKAALKVPNVIDVVYIDANHDYEHVKQDIKLWLPKIVQGGFICGHDYYTKFPGVIQAVNERFGKPDKVFRDTSWIVRIK